MRISTQAASQSALLDLMRAQRDAFEANQQLASGRKSPDLKGYGHQAETILAGRGALAREQAFITASQRLESRLAVQDLALGQISDATSSLRAALTTADGTYLMSEVETAFDSIKTALNTSFSGSFLFGGTRTDTPPFGAETLADVQAAATGADLFDNAARKQEVLIDDNTRVEVAPLASEIGTRLMDIFKRIADFNAGVDGPFDGAITSTQQTYLRGEISNVIAAFDEINALMGTNGKLQSRIADTITSHSQRADYLTSMISDFEDADMAQAASRFQQAQTAIQVSARTFSDLSQVSLLPFLR